MTTAAAVAVIAAEGAGDPTTALLTYGPLGIIAVCAIIAGRVAWHKFNELLTEATERANLAETKYDTVVSKLLNDIVPALTRSHDMSVEVLAELRRR